MRLVTTVLNGFPVDSVDRTTFADKVHFNHLSIDSHHDQVKPSLHGRFTSSELHALWKEIQKEYDKVLTIFN